MARRFRIAFSFAGEVRDFVAKTAAILAKEFGEEAILYDKYHEAEFARWDLGTYLTKLYSHEADLIVPVFCPAYSGKSWTEREWSHIHGFLINKADGHRVMPARFQNATADGLTPASGFIELDDKTPEQFAALILRRLELNDGKSTTPPVPPPAPAPDPWKAYLTRLNEELDGPLYDEPFSLRQIYIPLRVWYERSADWRSGVAGPSGRGEKKERAAADLTTHILAWLEQPRLEDTVRILSGGPGAGKSSTARMVTAEVLEKTGWRALFIPLHRIDYSRNLVPDIHRYLHDYQLFPPEAQPLERRKDGPRLLLVLDGLDELAMRGEAGQASAHEFARAVGRLVEERNRVALTLRVLLTGRTALMQYLASEFPAEGALLHLCPYFTPDQEKAAYGAAWPLLAKDQRPEWWNKYGALKGLPYTDVPAHFAGGNLVEITAEPLLCYLLALADGGGSFQPGRMAPENEIYAEVMRRLHLRPGPDGRHFGQRGLPLDDFHQVLEQIAVATWQGSGRSTTLAEVARRCGGPEWTKRLDLFREEAEKGPVRLLTAFYFRRTAGDGEDTFEFTHKSFEEYFVAGHLVRVLDGMCRRTEKQTGKPGQPDAPECLAEWARLCGPRSLTERQRDFLHGELALRGQECCAKWQALLCALIAHLARQGMPMERLEIPVYETARRQARRAMVSLFVTLSGCSRVTGEVSQIEWPQTVSAGHLLRLMVEQRVKNEAEPVFQYLYRMNLDGQELSNLGLRAANLRESSMRRTDFAFTSLGFANLSRANLSHANLSHVDLSGADLSGADLSGADLSRADLSRAKLSGTHLPGADLSGADLSQANLSQANLTRANLSGANFSRDHLRGANLSGANLSEANLSGANLTGAYLSEANLTRANLRGANLKRATPSRANLSGANLSGANLSGAFLSGANFSGAFLSEANLSEANLSGANLTGTHISEANLSGANLSEANLTGAFLPRAKLSGAILPRAKLSEAYLTGADLSGADLTGADFSRANLKGANFTGANLEGANLTGASFPGAILTGAIGVPPHLLPASGSSTPDAAQEE